MNQSAEVNQTPSDSGKSFSKLGIGLIVIAVLSLAAAGFTVLNSHAATVTQQQLMTTVQTVSNVQPVTVNNLVTVVTTATSTMGASQANMQRCGYYGCSYSGSNPNCGTSTCAYPTCGSNGCAFQLCGPNGCSVLVQGYTPQPQNCGFNGCPYTTCQSAGPDNSVQCAGYIYQDSNGCIELVVPVADYAVGAPVTSATQYYTLHNLPSVYPTVGSWVTIKGQLHLVAPNTATNGAACPGNYININSIS